VKATEVRLVGDIHPGTGALAVFIDALVHFAVIGGRKPESVPGDLAFLIGAFLESDLALACQIFDRKNGLACDHGNVGTLG
jgi:hypothetical protein